MELSDQIDCESIRRASAGDTGSLRQLADLVYRRVYLHIRRVIPDPDLAADLTQDTLLRVLRSLCHLRDPERFWPWVCTIASNATRQHLRSRRRRQVLFSTMTQGWLAEQPARDRHADSRTQEDKDELVAWTRSAMDRINERYREILSLRFFEEKSYDEMAASLGCAPVTARTLMFRAKNALRRELAASAGPWTAIRRAGTDKHARSSC
jgi:RNA polymerase sigma-70 factor, ECF subfamily